jgi:prophage regulatory protein
MDSMAILRTTDVIRLTGLSRTTLWRLERRGGFPARLRLGPNSVGWLDDEVRQWIKARPRGMAGAQPTVAFAEPVKWNPFAPGWAKETGTARLLRLAQRAELFHTPDGAGYADFDVNGHREIAQDRFRSWLERLFQGDAPRADQRVPCPLRWVSFHPEDTQEARHDG